VLDNVRPGDIVLMHSNNDRAATVEALPRIITGLREKGYEIVGLDVLLGRPAYKDIE
jgi:peptidoglycan/xylan/chitin deacetylase (PgdA/CDA1 family)